MSGGTWGYGGYKIQEALLNMVEDENSNISKYCPELAMCFKALGHALNSIEHDLDYHFAGDAHIEDMQFFETCSIAMLQNAVKRKEHTSE